ncbi:DUF3502 domain-containing protein [Lachnoclostridium sp. Marseille-P6806]|uniref:DUF3502 domain-containing protein n=1 Tax=Lachnoclostridium sp. Marseille-P6806 TaxID=2364793 RepID=UPI00102F4897|nr:DUF3502 domain-containing protein [Lachnoclostridium sp. Marseille-P6806]
MKRKKMWAGLLLTTALTVLTACGNSAVKTDGAGDASEAQSTENAAEEAADENQAAEEEAALEPVELTFYFIGEPARDNEMVWERINELLKEKINATIEPKYLSWGDWDQRYPLLFSSGEDFDMIYTADWALYSETASKGGFYPLTMDLIRKNCPMCVEHLPEVAWSSSAMNGNMYLIPQNNYFANHYGFMIRGDLREKYGMDEIKNVDQLEEYMDHVKKNEAGMIPLDISSDNAEMYMRAIVVYPDEHWYLAGEHTGVLTYDFTDPEKISLTPFYDLPGYEEHLERMARWNQKGFLSKSDLTSANAERFENGKSAVKLGNISDADAAWQAARVSHPDWKIEYVNLLEGKKLGSVGYSQGVAFNARTKNIDRAMMAADLLNYDPDINFLVNAGIPGVHNEILETVEYEGQQLQKTRAIDPEGYGGYSYWCFSNTPSIPEESFDGYDELMYSYFYQQAVHHPLDGMTFQTENVATEIANTSNVLSEYLPILYLGFTEDPKATLNEFKEKLHEAGIEAVNEEMEKQAEARFEAAQ